MPIDLAQVNWLYVIILSFFVFIASLIGNVLSWQSRSTAAGLTALLFAVIFIAWSYYPHGLPLPTRLGDMVPRAAAPAQPTAPAAPAAPARPANPVKDITPPRNPVTDITPPRNPVTDVTPQR
ncbi:MAG: hypothetical protein JSR61_10735 [Proteobacteria bacterium]|nr:hypothetical protein [Pseudomonadota bacterium]